MGVGLYLIVAGTLITGAANSLFTKYQDNQCVSNCNNPDLSTHRYFEQPAIQTLQMFVGEFSMFLVYYLVYKVGQSKRRGEYVRLNEQEEGQTEEIKEISIFSNIKLAIPAVCDLCGTTLLNIGLVYTPVSIYQMTRGTIVLFVAILSVIFLHRRISKLEWISLFFVTLGVGLVGLSGSNNSSESGTGTTTGLIIFGMFLIVLAEILQAFQFVVEEHILEKNKIIPLQLVYIEGFYGFSILLAVMILLNFIIGFIQPAEQFQTSPFNMVEAFSEVFFNRAVLLSSICIMISIAAFNYCGLSITHRISATARSTVDTCRTLLVWIVAISMGWETFQWLQFTGFAVLVFGTLCFNGVLKPEEWKFIPQGLKSDFNPNQRLIDVVDEIDEPIERL
ncbi:Solute carrier family 35 member F6 [Spathaspora sp. JA1]|nr:Solute carrier family 35 member F6 [Spathaspora sp. JA1]